MTLEDKRDPYTDSNIEAAWSLRPGSFTALMALYESNYLRFNWLLDEMDCLKGQYISQSDQDFSLYLTVNDVSRYTTSIHLTYWFENEGPHAVADPDIDIRIYHDARVAEAMACRHNRRHKVLQGFVTDHGTELSRRWARNMMLNKWLEYCVDADHRFKPLEAAADRLEIDPEHIKSK